MISPRLFVLLLILLTAPLLAATAGELTDAGPNGHFFYDADSGLYWFDVVLFEGESRYQVATLIDNSPRWDWATSTQIDALVGQTAPSGGALADAMGASQTGSVGTIQRWVGFHSLETQPDGWLIQADSAPYTTINTSGSQSNVGSQTHGAWVVSTSDPATSDRLVNCGDSGEFFSDAATGFYWADPVTFLDMTRVEVQAWIDAHADGGWRWATAAEVAGLVGKMSEGDVALTAIMGTQQHGANPPRWIGYYDQATEPDGLLMEANWLPELSMVTVFGTQAGVSNWTHGAWVLTEDDPTPVEQASWSEVKSIFR